MNVSSNYNFKAFRKLRHHSRSSNKADASHGGGHWWYLHQSDLRIPEIQGAVDSEETSVVSRCACNAGARIFVRTTWLFAKTLFLDVSWLPTLQYLWYWVGNSINTEVHRQLALAIPSVYFRPLLFCWSSKLSRLTIRWIRRWQQRQMQSSVHLKSLYLRQWLCIYVVATSQLHSLFVQE